MNWSNLDTCALLAASCAALNRATRCSGVSPKDEGASGRGAPGVPAGGAEAAAAAAGRANLGSGARLGLEGAWGVFWVKRVASETLRGVVVIAIVGMAPFPPSLGPVLRLFTPSRGKITGDKGKEEGGPGSSQWSMSPIVVASDSAELDTRLVAAFGQETFFFPLCPFPSSLKLHALKWELAFR